MFCPKCGQQWIDSQKFCKACGTNLIAVDAALSDPRSMKAEQKWRRLREEHPGLNEAELNGLVAEWSDKWADKRGRNRSLTSLESRTVRYERLMQSGIVVSFVGIALSVFFYFLFHAVAKQPGNSSDAEVISALWAIGLIPLFIGLGLLFNGWLFRPRHESGILRDAVSPNAFGNSQSRPHQLAEANPLLFDSVTAQTTRHLPEEPVYQPRQPVDEPLPVRFIDTPERVTKETS